MNPLEIEDREIELVPIKGGAVHVRSLSAGEQIDLDAAMEGKQVKDLLTLQIQAYVCTEVGEPLFNLEQAGTFLAKRHPTSIKKIITAATRLNAWDAGSGDSIKGNS